MSHFIGLVVLTPDYLKKHELEDALSKYDENLEVPEYSEGEVSDFEKVQFIKYYKSEDGTISDNSAIDDPWNTIYKRLLEDGKIEAYDEEKHSTIYLYLIDVMGQEAVERAYVELFNELFPGLFEEFDSLYEKNGSGWNGNSWRINHISGKWERYTQYNPNSKWDWYSEGGRWDGAIKTKDGEFVNDGVLGDIDWTDFKPEDYKEKTEKDFFGKEYRPLKDGVIWHFTRSSIPFCLVVDGEWIEKGQMGWFGISTNDKEEQDWNDEFFSIIDKLPENSEFHLIDFHI
jgi:hypothetical protein